MKFTIAIASIFAISQAHFGSGCDVDESQNYLGPSQCFGDNQCTGDRVCSIEEGLEAGKC